jgi:hypothetical protein
VLVAGDIDFVGIAALSAGDSITVSGMLLQLISGLLGLVVLDKRRRSANLQPCAT